MTITITPLILIAFVILSACGQATGRLVYDRGKEWIWRRRSQQLERRVAAELLSRGYTLDHISLDAVGGDTPGPVTDEMVTRIADECAMIMQFSHRPPDQP